MNLLNDGIPFLLGELQSFGYMLIGLPLLLLLAWVLLSAIQLPRIALERLLERLER
jgi:hypothetical protein